mgnify:FL=1
MDMLKIFEKAEFGRVCVVECEGEPWFVAKDVCECLELTDVSKTISLLDDDEKGTNSIRTPGGEQQMLVISEPGLYSLILRSRKPEAKAFSKWVRSEVLPNLRKTGGYGVPEKTTPRISPAELEKLIADKVMDTVFRYRDLIADTAQGVKALEATRPVPPAEPTEREILEQCIRDYVAEVGAAHDVATARDERKPIVNPNMARGNVLLNITHFSEWFGAHKAASRLRIFTTQALSGALRRMHCRKVNLAYLRPDGGKSSFSLYVTNIHS